MKLSVTTIFGHLIIPLLVLFQNWNPAHLFMTPQLRILKNIIFLKRGFLYWIQMKEQNF